VIERVLASAVVLTTPLLLAALGGLINRRGGLINIGLEGKMLVGAFVAAIVSAATGTWLLALAAAALAGGIVGLLFSWSVTRLRANEIIAGFGLNIFVAGVIGFLLTRLYDSSSSLRPEGMVKLPRLHLPVIADVPLLGVIVSGRDPLTWVAWALVPLVAWLLYRTRWGLHLRATGAAPTAALAIGLPVLRIRDTSTTIAGALAGLGGAHLTLGIVGLFNDSMIAGRGFIAFAAFYFGRARPLRTAAACVLFAIFDAMQVRLQGQNVPAELVQTLPYVVVIAVLAFTGIRAARARTSRVVAIP
jgi:simple sugar transport system permease protein